MTIIMGKGCLEAIYGLMGWKGLNTLQWELDKASCSNNIKDMSIFYCPLLLQGLPQEVAQTFLPVLTSCTEKLVGFLTFLMQI